MDLNQEHAFTVEFQPSGLRLILDEPTTLLDAARQAGVLMRADCGGKGICGKCRIQLLSDLGDYPAAKADISRLDQGSIDAGFRLACETIAQKDIKVFIPPDSIIEGQILQVDGWPHDVEVNSSVNRITVTLKPAQLNDLRSDMARVKDFLNLNDLAADLNVLKEIPRILRQNQWSADLVIREQRIISIVKPGQEKLIGLAVDVGSTKLACYLMDLESGELLAARGTPNPQIAYGEDIMARIAHALQSEQNAKRLQTILFDAINQTSQVLAEEVGLETDSIVDVCMVGNTAMHHLFLHVPVDSLAVSPFVPAFNEAIYPSAVELDMTAMHGSGIYTPPVIAGFVGSDHLAFLLAEGFGEDQRVRLGIDIGTNTEIALQKGNEIVSVSTASGPAFEGAHIRFGMRAAPAAIEHVTLDSRGSAEIQVIGNLVPIGICGSGILDAVAEMRRVGMLNPRGRMVRDFPGVHLDGDGKPYIQLTEGSHIVTLSQKDVDQILLAKGAIRAGIDILMDHLNVKPAEIEEVVIAGAFGTFMLPEHAMRIGMLPQIPMEKVQAVGNAAGAGARMMLISKSARAKAESLARQIRYLELTVYPEFPMFYARGIQA
jgi:uncharacterized 2Fe-2S/4Fe-4S cluster protein (DUF4445 family)